MNGFTIQTGLKVDMKKNLSVHEETTAIRSKLRGRNIIWFNPDVLEQI